MKIRKSTKAEIAKSAANVAMVELMGLAEKDPKALEAFMDLLCYNIRRVNARAMKPDAPAHYGSLMRRSPQWVGFISPDQDCIDDNEWFVKHFQIGSESGLKLGGQKQWSRRTPENGVALRLIEILKRTSNLPPLTKATAAAWWKKAQPHFETIYGKDFENHPRFKHYLSKRDSSTRPLARWELRKKISSSIAQSFRSIAQEL